MPYTLLIAEKPSAAKRIADALAEGDVEEIDRHGVKSFMIRRNGKEIVVAPAVGHLFMLSEKNPGGTWTYPVFDVQWRPNFEKGSASLWSKKYFENIKSLAKDASDFISSCDYDIEGSLIAYNILRFICGTEKAKRMKFSTLTTPDLIEAYDDASKDLDFPQIEAGLARHTLDFFWGVNLSRALTLSLKSAGGYKTLSTGRVQGPTLEILERRQREIEAFKPVPYWQLQLTCSANGEKMAAMHEKDKFWEKAEAEAAYGKSKGGPAKVLSVDRSQQKLNPPFPLDLTTLQREAYRCFGYSPKMTLDVAQSLYEQALISYPRTSSQELTPKIGYKGIIKNLGNQMDYGKLCERLLKKENLLPTRGPKKDPAHPAIYPTGNRPKALNSYQKKVYDLIVKRFLSVFGEPAVREAIKAVIGMGSERFVAEGIRTIEQNWMEFYMPYAKFKEVVLPQARPGQMLDVLKLEILDKETQPPKRYTQAAVLKEMESLGLGTKATRALILDTLYERGYIEDRNIMVTKLGQAVVTALERYAPDVISVELTRKFEQDMESIQDGNKKWTDIVQDAEAALKTVLADFKKHETAVGKSLLDVVIEQHRMESTVGKCKCGGNLIIRRSRKGKRFIGCDSYPKCTETFSLPQSGNIKVVKEKCTKCGLNVVSVKSSGKRPWSMCVRCGFVGGKGSAIQPAKPSAVDAKQPAKPPQRRRKQKAAKAPEPSGPESHAAYE